MCQCKITPSDWNRLCAVVELLRRSMGAFLPREVGHNRIKWLGVRWVGLPRPLRWVWWALRAQIAREHGDAPRVPPGDGYGVGCGCVYAIKVRWVYLKRRWRSHG